ncbi:hypothetical protein OF83DRAFT_301464 [Amylostereum chailletii]|nr:hypothetical protein OF83DRAFT_301464 [Amylostereum chailletii]
MIIICAYLLVVRPSLLSISLPPPEDFLQVRRFKLLMTPNTLDVYATYKTASQQHRSLTKLFALTQPRRWI